MYTLPPPSGFLPTDLRDQMRRWLRSHRSVGAIERPGEWLLFADSAMQAAVQRPLDRVPNAPQYGHASIWLRDDAVDLETAREPETDRAQHAFTLWAQQQAPLIPKDSGILISADALIDPELYG